MAFLIRPKESNYLASETHNADTHDYEDHTFSGMMFDVLCKADLPVKFIEIQSCWIRGDLGPIRIFTTPGSFRGKHLAPDQWQLVYKGHNNPSDDLKEIKLVHPIRVDHGHSAGVYIHSALPGDSALVYANQRSRTSHEDIFMKILPGMADLTSQPFSNRSPWGGHWGGSGWRQNREFVGRLTYGIKYILWNPPTHRLFTPEFKNLVVVMLLVDNRLRVLQNDTMFYILNMCRWDWSGVGKFDGKAHKKPPRDHEEDWRMFGGSRFRRRYTESDSEESSDDEEEDVQANHSALRGVGLRTIIRAILQARGQSERIHLGHVVRSVSRETYSDDDDDDDDGGAAAAAATGGGGGAGAGAGGAGGAGGEEEEEQDEDEEDSLE